MTAFLSLFLWSSGGVEVSLIENLWSSWLWSFPLEIALQEQAFAAKEERIFNL